MELRRPTLADKETILNMMAEFEETQSAHDGGFWDAENFDYKNWLETNLNKEMGIGLPENRVPSIQFVLFDDSGHALGFESTAETKWGIAELCWSYRLFHPPFWKGKRLCQGSSPSRSAN